MPVQPDGSDSSSENTDDQSLSSDSDDSSDSSDSDSSSSDSCVEPFLLLCPIRGETKGTRRQQRPAAGSRKGPIFLASSARGAQVILCCGALLLLLCARRESEKPFGAEDQAAAPLPEPTDFELLEVTLLPALTPPDHPTRAPQAQVHDIDVMRCADTWLCRCAAAGV